MRASLPLPGIRRRPPRPNTTATPGHRLVVERLRHISPWSVLKVSAIFYSCLALAFLVATMVLWQFARSSELVDDAESFVTQLFTYGDCVPEDELELGQEARADEDCPEGSLLVGGFEIQSGALFQAATIAGLLFVVVATVGTVLMALLFNLLSDLTGGVRYSVVREPLPTGSAASRSTGRHKAR